MGVGRFLRAQGVSCWIPRRLLSSSVQSMFGSTLRDTWLNGLVPQWHGKLKGGRVLSRVKNAEASSEILAPNCRHK